MISFYRGLLLKFVLVVVAICMSLLVPETTQFVSVVALVCILILTALDFLEDESVNNAKKMYTKFIAFLTQKKSADNPSIISQELRDNLNRQFVSAQAINYNIKDVSHIRSVILSLEKHILNYTDIKRAQMTVVESNLPEFVKWFTQILARGITVEESITTTKSVADLTAEIQQSKIISKSAKAIKEIVDARDAIAEKTVELKAAEALIAERKDIEQHIYEMRNVLEQCMSFNYLVKKQKEAPLIQQEYKLIKTSTEKMRHRLAV
jgi:hypothetical protein